MEKAKVYVSKSKDPNDFAKLGYYVMMPDQTGSSDIIVYIPITLKRDDNPVVSVINWFNGDSFHENIKNDKDTYENFKRHGVRFENAYSDKDGKIHKRVILDEEAYAFFCSWRMEINTSDDNMIMLTMGDAQFPIGFCNCSVIDKYCTDEIKKLKEAGIVEEREEPLDA